MPKGARSPVEVLDPDRVTMTHESAIMVTGWEEFERLSPDGFVDLMRIPAVVDGRRLYDPGPYMKRLRFAAIELGAEQHANRCRIANIS